MNAKQHYKEVTGSDYVRPPQEKKAKSTPKQQVRRSKATVIGTAFPSGISAIVTEMCPPALILPQPLRDRERDNRLENMRTQRHRLNATVAAPVGS